MSGSGRGRCREIDAAYNKPSATTQGAKTITFDHEVDHQHFKPVSPEGATLYLDPLGVQLLRSATSLGIELETK